MLESEPVRTVVYFTAASSFLLTHYQDSQLKKYWLNNLTQEAQDNCLGQDRNLLSNPQGRERIIQTRETWGQNACWDYYADLKRQHETDLMIDYSLMMLSASAMVMLMTKCMIGTVRARLSSLTGRTS